MKHDIPFVEICNSMIHKHYTDRNIPVTRDIEFNDGCNSQFKCISAFPQFSYRSVTTTRVYFETSHGKSKSDGLRGVVKCAATREVNGRKDSVTEKGFYHRMFSCLCEKCLNGMYAECLLLESTFSPCQQLITRKWHNFSTESSNEDPVSDSDESDDDEMYFAETEACLLIKTDDIAVIKTGDDFPYYLLKLTCEPYTTEANEKDDYNHTFPINHKVVKGHYMEVFKETKDGDIYYLDLMKTAIISCFSVV